MAAVAGSLLCHLKAGDHVVSARALFGSCRYIVEDLLPRYGIATTLIDGRDLKAWEQAVRPNTRAFFFETPTNPVLELVDIEGVSKIAKQADALVVVDNVFATPLLQRPMPLGADIVVYSATKHIDSQGRCLGGVVLGPEEFIEEKLHNYLKHTGPSLSPFNAWVLLKGLETLPVRVERHCASAAAIADFLAGRKEVVRVFYPGRADHPQAALAKQQMAGGGPMVAFEGISCMQQNSRRTCCMGQPLPVMRPAVDTGEPGSREPRSRRYPLQIRDFTHEDRSSRRESTAPDSDNLGGSLDRRL